MTVTRTGSRKMARYWSVAGVLLMLALAFSSTYTAIAAPPGNQSFQRTWERTDMPVLDGEVSRTWMWGPQANYPVMQEPYAEAPGGMREVQYYDKARMEITHPSEDANSIWYVTNGLLVVELITGQMQTGDATFEPKNPAAINVAGDFDDPTGPTYETFGGLLDATPRAVGSTIAQRVDRAGIVTDDPSLTSQGVTVGYLDEVTNHAIATPFWDFMNSSGPVYENGQYTDAKLFENPYFATGRPITEAYWANVKVAGTYKDVLMQCFERRCLTYTPGNSDGFVVEAGNVGQHYYAWRYGNDGGTPETPDSPDTPDDPAPDPATRYDFAGSWGTMADGMYLSRPHMVAVAPTGEYYVTNTNRDQVLKFSASGVLLTSWGTAGTGNGQFRVPIGIDVDKDGNVYVADFGNHRIQKFNSDGAFITVWGGYGSDQGQFKNPYDVSVGPDEILYVTDSNNNRVQRFTLDGTFGGMWGDLGTAIGQFSNPYGIDVSAGGLVFVADTGNNRVQIFDGAGVPQGNFGQSGSGDGQFNLPLDLTAAGDGTVYVSDAGNDRIQMFRYQPVVAPADTRTLSSVLYLYSGILGEAGAFDNPTGLTTDGGRVLVADTGNSRIRIYANTGVVLRSDYNLVDSWQDDSRGRFRSVNDLALGKDGRVYVTDLGRDEPGFELDQIQVFNADGVYLDQWRDIMASGLVFDSQGNLFTLNNTAGRIEKYSPDGELITFWGPDGAQARILAAQVAMAVDADDNVYIVGGGLASNVQKFSPDGTFIRAWGASGSQPGQFANPSGIAIYGGYVYVADTGNHRIQVFDLDGEFIRQWGSQGTGNGQFDEPHGIAIDEYGYVYVTEVKNNRIQKFTPEGEFLAKWGSEGAGAGEFRGPTTIAVDGDGTVYVADSGNYRIQTFEPVS